MSGGCFLGQPASVLVQVALGEHGVASGIAPGKGYVDVSTVDVATVLQIASAIRGKGGSYLEAPVSGSKGPAIAGQLIFLTGGWMAQTGRPSLWIRSGWLHVV
jgi:glyoxylate/succinic semialdehyde reductase